MLIGLSEAECRILEFVILLKNEPLLDVAAETLGNLSPTKIPFIFSTLLDIPPTAVNEALSDKSVLCRSGLITINSSPLVYVSNKLELISDTFAEKIYLQNTDPINFFRDMVTPSSAAELNINDYAHISPAINLLKTYLEHAIETRKKGVNILLHGVPGTGKSQLTKALAQEIGCELFEISSEDSDGDPINGKRRLSAYHISQNFFRHRKVLITFEEAEDIFDDGDTVFGRKSTAQTHKAWINRTLEENTIPSIWFSNNIRYLDPAYIRRFDMILELPIPPKSQREKIIQALGNSLLDQDITKRMAESTALAPAVINRAIKVIAPLQKNG
ncbi:MAG: AAA family ATPase [Alcaligenaceae bacterium]|nr:AAA family ATPase [Alcaligenaceae bacterium]